MPKATKKYSDGGPLGRPMTKSEMYAAAEKAYSPLAKAAAAKNAKFAGKTIAGDTTDPAEIAELKARKNYQSVYRDYVKSQGAPTGSDVEESARRAGVLKDGGNIPGYKKRTQRKMARAHEKAEKAGEKPMMYKTVRGKADPRTLTQSSKKVAVYKEERRIQNEADYKAAEKEGKKNVRELAKNERQRQRRMKRVGPPKTKSSSTRGLGLGFVKKSPSGKSAAQKQTRMKTAGRKRMSRRSGCDKGAAWCK